MRVKANQDRVLFKKGKGEMSWISWVMMGTVLGKCFRPCFLLGKVATDGSPASV